jgi:hypothetical protein
VQFAVFAQQVIATQPVRRNVPDSHVDVITRVRR